MRNPYLKSKPPLPESNNITSSSSSSRSPPQTSQHSVPQSSAHQDEATSAVRSLSTNAATAVVPKESASALIISASAKAGMEGLDRSQIDEIILRESGNSKFMQEQRRRDAKVNERIAHYQQRKHHQQQQQATSLSDYAITPALEQKLQAWQRAQPTRSTCVVVDMDMFYMACELLDKPHLQHVPACVGRGMILTSNYMARKYGVRSAMPGWIGDKLVQELSGGTQTLRHVPANFDLYKEKSVQVKDVLREFDPHLKSYSLDEAYLELGPYLALYLQQQPQQQQNHHHHHPSEKEQETATSKTRDDDDNYDDCTWDHAQIRQTLVATTERMMTDSFDWQKVLQGFSSYTCRQALEPIVHYMRQRVRRATGGLTCSAGMAPNVSLAKIASDQNKPNGQCFVDPSHVLEFIWPLDVRKIPGIGRVTEKILKDDCCEKIQTVQDLYHRRGLIHWLFPPATRDFLLRASIGCMGNSSSSSNDSMDEDGSSNAIATTSATDSSSESHQKGISRERTFAPNDCWTTLNIKLEDIAQLLSQDMIRKKVLAHTVTVKAKLHTFDVYSRSKSLDRGVYIQSRHELVAIVAPMLAQIKAEHFAKAGSGGASSLSSSSSCKSFSCRLIGIRCSNLVEEEEFSSQAQQQETLDRFLSSASAKLNDDSSSAPTSSSCCSRSEQVAAFLAVHSKPKVDDSDSKSKTTSTIKPLDSFLGKTCGKTTTMTATAGGTAALSTTTPMAVTPLPTKGRQNSSILSLMDASGNISPRTNTSRNIDVGSTSSRHLHRRRRHRFGPLHPNDEESSSTETTVTSLSSLFVECPLCQRKFPLSENIALNQHVDTCLNGSTVRHMVRKEGDEETTTAPKNCPAAAATGKKRQRLTDWWQK